MRIQWVSCKVSWSCAWYIVGYQSILVWRWWRWWWCRSLVQIKPVTPCKPNTLGYCFFHVVPSRLSFKILSTLWTHCIQNACGLMMPQLTSLCSSAHSSYLCSLFKRLAPPSRIYLNTRDTFFFQPVMLRGGASVRKTETWRITEAKK